MAGFSVTTSTTICALLIFFAVCYLPAAGSVFFNYTSFNQEVQQDIKIEGNASFGDGWIDISANRFTGIGNSTGRASYAHPVPLWEGTTGKVASFTTRFSFIINPVNNIIVNNNKGDGMAFFLAPYPSILPANSQGYNLGLTNESDGGRFVAVEFDAYSNPEVLDPNITYDHIGIDVNSVRSVNNLSLPNFSLNGSMNAEIEYNNVSSILSVMLWLGDGRNQNYSLSYKVDLKSALPEQVAVGFSAATGASIELHQLLSWYFKSSLEPPPSPSSSGSGHGGVIAGATAGAALFIVLLVAMATLFVRRWNKKRQAEEEIGSEGDDGEPVMEIEMGTGPRRFLFAPIFENCWKNWLKGRSLNTTRSAFGRFG